VRRRGRRSFGCGLSLLALEDGLERIARLGDIREIEGRLVFLCGPVGTGRTCAAAQITAHLLGLVLLDGARMRLLLGDADRSQSVQDGLALDFQFPRKIVDANFAHLFLLLRAAVIRGPDHRA
jgi:hypothetical protein